VAIRAMLERTVALGASLPAVGRAADKLCLEAKEGASERRRLALLLTQHDQVLEVLEMAQLTTTCVRSGWFEEALELDAAAAARALLHPDVPALVSVAVDVRACLAEMHERLFSKLAGALTLPEALHTIGLLRRLPPPYAMAEAPLRVSFLRNRTLHLQRARAALPDAQEQPVDHLLRLLELCRVHWYDDVIQYRAIFCFTEPAESDATSEVDRILRKTPLKAEPPPLEPVTVHLPVGEGELIAVEGADGGVFLKNVPAGLSAGEDWTVELPTATWGDPRSELNPLTLVQGDRLCGAILASWAVASVDELLRSVRDCLSRVHDGAYVASIAENASYTCASLGRVGLDISALLHQHIRDAALRIWSSCLRGATDHWLKALRGVHWAAPPASAAAIAALSPVNPTSILEGSGSHDGVVAPPVPPIALLRFVPLAVLCNHMMASFNQLRPLADYELREPAVEALGTALCECASALHACTPNAAAAGEHGMAHHAMMVRSFFDELTPHVVSCLRVMLPQWSSSDIMTTHEQTVAPSMDDGWEQRILRRLRDALGLQLSPEGGEGNVTQMFPKASRPPREMMSGKGSNEGVEPADSPNAR